MPLYLNDAVDLTVGILYTLLRVAIDNLNPFRERLNFDSLHTDTKLFSKLIGEDVVSVVPKQKEAVGLGSGGTGTTRKAFTVQLRDGRILNVFAKTATNGLMERVFLNQFGVYDNELSFYQSICPTLSQEFSTKSGDGWSPCPKVYCAR